MIEYNFSKNLNVFWTKNSLLGFVLVQIKRPRTSKSRNNVNSFWKIDATQSVKAHNGIIYLSRHFHSLVNVSFHVSLRLQCTCTWYSFIKCYLPSWEIAIICGGIFSQAVDLVRWLRYFEIILLYFVRSCANKIMNKQQAKIIFISTTSASTYAMKIFEERFNLNWSECHSKEGISFYLQFTTRSLLYFWLVTFCWAQNRFRNTIEST